MVIEIDEESIALAISETDDLGDALDDFTTKRHPQSLFSAIENAVDEDVINPILKRAKKLARPHVGDRTSEIKPVKGDWMGDSYVAGLRSDNEVVLSHEYGSGQYTTNGPYIITPNKGNEVLAFEIDGRSIVVNYVVHPGVRGKRFMQRAVREHADKTAQNALDEAQQNLDESLTF